MLVDWQENEYLILILRTNFLNLMSAVATKYKLKSLRSSCNKAHLLKEWS
jgi:hypothetical protein